MEAAIVAAIYAVAGPKQPSLGVCTTASATSAKELTIDDFSLVPGVSVQIVFAAVNTAANPTLNINGTGAKPVTCYGIPVEVGQLAKGQVYTLIYSGTAWQIVGGMAPYPIGQYVWFEDELVRPGFKPCNANVVSNFSATYPQMAAYLSTTHGAKRIFGSLAEYEAAHNAAWATLADGSQIRWNNIGGVAKFWWDKSADTLLMPDLTGLLREMAGYDSLGVGGTHIDTIREITGLLSGCGAWGNSKNNRGLFVGQAPMYNNVLSNGNTPVDSDALFRAGAVVPTGNANKPRAWGALACCYLGTPAQ